MAERIKTEYRTSATTEYSYEPPHHFLGVSELIGLNDRVDQFRPSPSVLLIIMATEYSLNLVKGSDPEMFSLTGMDRSACEIKSMYFATEEQIRATYKEKGMTAHEIDAWIERARQLAAS